MDRATLDQGNETTCIATINSPSLTVGHFPHVNNRHRHTSAYSNRINITVTALWVATPLLSTVSVAAVCVAVSTNQWLLTQENMKNENYSGKGDDDYIPKKTVSGLWTLCYTNPGKHEFFCSNIEYFPNEEYSPDLKDSTMAIPYTVTKSAAFFILSTFLLFVGEFCCLFGHFSRQRRLLTFISGLTFIISGLLMLIGLVMYISIFKAEVGGKLRPTSQLQPAVFTYHYGYSFILYVSGFVSTEISGTCAVFLYIYWHQKDWRKKGYAVRSKLISSTMAFDIEPINNLYPFCKMHSPYMASEGGRGGGLGSDEISKTFTPTLQRRLYLDRGNGVNLIDEFYSPICLKHSLSCSMVNELLPEGIPKKQNRMVDTNDFNETCPPLSSARCPHHLTSAQSYEFFLPNCFPRTESSNAENENWKNGEQDELDECSSTATHDHDFVPFDLDETVSVPTNCKNFNDTFKEDEFLKALSKTTPV